MFPPPISKFAAASDIVRRCFFKSGDGDTALDPATAASVVVFRGFVEVASGEMLSLAATRGCFKGGISLDWSRTELLPFRLCLI